jgi:hypothetical protein
MSTGSLAVLGHRQWIKALDCDSHKDNYGTNILILQEFQNK